jgi:hypothetical protein
MQAIGTTAANIRSGPLQRIASTVGRLSEARDTAFLRAARGRGPALLRDRALA